MMFIPIIAASLTAGAYVVTLIQDRHIKKLEEEISCLRPSELDRELIEKIKVVDMR